MFGVVATDAVDTADGKGFGAFGNRQRDRRSELDGVFHDSLNVKVK
jgi:hypothetical protein